MRDSSQIFIFTNSGIIIIIIIIIVVLLVLAVI